jgi:hypothetical protein
MVPQSVKWCAAIDWTLLRRICNCLPLSIRDALVISTKLRNKAESLRSNRDQYKCVQLMLNRVALLLLSQWSTVSGNHPTDLTFSDKRTARETEEEWATFVGNGAPNQLLPRGSKFHCFLRQLYVHHITLDGSVPFKQSSLQPSWTVSPLHRKQRHS